MAIGAVPAGLVPVLLVGLALLPGSLALALWPVRVADPLEAVFGALALGLAGLGWVALVTAELGEFSLAALGAVWILATSVLLWRVIAGRAWGKWKLRWAGVSRWEGLGLAIWLAVAGWLFFRPHEFVIGAADAGVYVNLGASIAHTGSIIIQDPTLAGLDRSLYPALLRSVPPNEAAAPYYLLPAFYVFETPAGRVIPQFYHLHPVWQAVGYAMAGVRGELMVTPLWGILGSLAVYFCGRRLWGARAGWLALVALTGAGLQVWFARYPTAEMLTQYLFWTGMWAVVAWWDERPACTTWPAIAGLALGELFLTRIDMYALLAIPAAAGMWLVWKRLGRRTDLWLVLPMLGLAGHSLLHGYLISRPYFVALMTYSSSMVKMLIGPALGVLLIATLLGWMRGRSPGRVSALQGTAVTNLAKAVGALALCLAAAWAYFVRPRVFAATSYPYWYGGGQLPALDHENLVRLGWYLGPIGIGVGVAGIAWMIRRSSDRRTALLLGFGIFFSFLYLWRIQANPSQIYAMRRYAPVVAPFFLLAGAFVLDWFLVHARRRGRWVAVVLTALWLSTVIYQARGLVSQVDYRGMIAQLDSLNADLPSHSVLLVNDRAPVGLGDFIGTPLRFLYGHDVFVIREPALLDTAVFGRAVADWLADGRSVYWMTVADGSQWPLEADRLLPARSYLLSTSLLESSYEHRPNGIVPVSWRFSLAPVLAAR